MVQTLPAPQVVSCDLDERFHSRQPTLRLRWDPTTMGLCERLWELPEGVCMVGPAPERFGVCVQRLQADKYSVRLVWNHTCLNWAALKRAQLQTSSLAPLLQAMGYDLYGLLDQPVHAESTLPRK